MLKERYQSGSSIISNSTNLVALDEGHNILDPHWIQRSSDEQLENVISLYNIQVFRSDSEEAVPLLEERINVLRESSLILIQVYKFKSY